MPASRPARRITFTAPGKVAVEPFEIGPPAADQLLIETLYSAISPGTERANLLAEANTTTLSRGYPFYPGYSNVGRIAAVGSDVRGFRVGQLVATNRPHASHLLLPATTGPGLPPEKYRSQFASSFGPDVPAGVFHLVWPLPADAGPAVLKACATFKLAMVGLGGVRKAGIELGESVVVFGLGAIGLYALRFAKLAGGVPVIGVDPAGARRHVAQAMGADAVYADASGINASDSPLEGRLPNVVIEATGRPDVIPPAFRACGRHGRVVLLGSTRGVTESVNFYTDVHQRALTVIAHHEGARPVFQSAPGNWTAWDEASAILRLICSGRLDCGPLVTHQFPAARAPEAYATVSGSPDALCVVLDWTAHAAA